MDLALDPDTGDLALSDGALQLLTGPEEVAQRLRLSLGVHTGEWLLNTGFGTDWLGAVLGKARSARADAEIKRAILATPGVARLTAWSATRTGRTLAITFAVALDDGSTLDGTLGTGARDDTAALGAELFLTLLPGRRRPGAA